MHELRRAVVARTNNPLQRFNRELNAAFDTPHPSLIRFVQTIVEISRRYVKLRDDIARSIASPPRRDMQPDLPTPVNLPENYDEEDVHSDQRDCGDDVASGADASGDGDSGDDSLSEPDGEEEALV